MKGWGGQGLCGTEGFVLAIESPGPNSGLGPQIIVEIERNGIEVRGGREEPYWGSGLLGWRVATWINSLYVEELLTYYSYHGLLKDSLTDRRVPEKSSKNLNWGFWTSRQKMWTCLGGVKYEGYHCKSTAHNIKIVLPSYFPGSLSPSFLSSDIY